MKGILLAVIAIAVVGFCSVEFMCSLDIAAQKAVSHKEQMAQAMAD